MATLIKVALIDDDAMVGEGLAHLLTDRGLDVCSVSTSLETGLARILAQRPDVVVCDVMLDGRAAGLGLPQLLAGSRAQGTPVILLSSFGPDSLVDLAQRTGAAAYVTKGGSADHLASVVRVVAAGDQVFPESRGEGHVGPTPRELEVIRAVADGLATKQIAPRVGMSERTVETHLRDLSRRYGVSNRTQLVVLAIRNGWITELPIGAGTPGPRTTTRRLGNPE